MSMALTNKEDNSLFCLLYVTFPDKLVAETVIHMLLGDRLIACANIFAPVSSFFHWHGKIERSEEVAVILKTKQDHFKEIERQIICNHTHTVPCILQIPIDKISCGFAQWMDEEIISLNS